MEYEIVLCNYLACLFFRGKSHSRITYIRSAVTGLLVSWLGVWICRDRPVRSWHFQKELLKCMWMAFFVETVFYWAHRLLHTRKLFTYHALHHVAVDPVPVDGIVASWLEIVLTGSLPFFGAVWIVRPHFRVYHTMLLTGLPFLMFVHGPYDDRHRQHHARLTCNYGNTRMWDVICGTGKIAL